ncbi:MAG: flavodoxin family protein [Spirochaetaceae bacterium]|nr:flavodoxin family protein [Spirochaetaceae bacterium]
MIRILGVCGSPRRAATFYALETALAAAREVEGVKTTLLELEGKKIIPCTGCNKCAGTANEGCQIHQDEMNQLYEDFFDYDGVLIATPVFSMGISGQLAAYFSRFRPDCLKQRENPDKMLFTPGAAMAVGGTSNGGQESAITVIHGFFHSLGMIVVNGGFGIYGGAAVWSQDKPAAGFGEDIRGIGNARVMGRRLANAAAVIKKGIEPRVSVHKEPEPKIRIVRPSV